MSGAFPSCEMHRFFMISEINKGRVTFYSLEMLHLPQNENRLLKYYVMKRFSLSLLAFAICAIGFAQKGGTTFPLYKGQIPNNKPNIALKKEVLNAEQQIFYHISEPTLTVFRPADGVRNTGIGVVVCPGGGYGCVCYGWEGQRIAEAFAKVGITSFVVCYRLPESAVAQDSVIPPLQDAQAALIYAREHAGQYGLNPNKIGIMGFSAGGHLASTVGTHYQKSYVPNPKKTSVRPDFMVLVYPVITMLGESVNLGTRKNLLGNAPSREQLVFYSNEQQVTGDTPPAFIVVANDDRTVPVENSIMFYQAMLQNKRPAELHAYEAGDHSFFKQPEFEEWMGRVVRWMKLQ